MPIYTQHSEHHYEMYNECPKTQKIYPFLNIVFDLKPRCESKMHVALLVKRGNILALALNKIASRSRGASSRGSKMLIHAERNLVSQTPHKMLRGADMYVLRLVQRKQRNSSGLLPKEFAYSQPCEECTVMLHKCMRDYGLKNVFFSI